MTDYGREWQQDGRRSQVLRAVREAYSGHGLQGPDLARIGEASSSTHTREPSVRRTGQAGGTARPDDSGILRRAVVRARVADLGRDVEVCVMVYALRGCVDEADTAVRSLGVKGTKERLREVYRMGIVRLCALLPSDV